MDLAIHDLRKQIYVTLLEDRKRRWMSDNQNSLREFYKTDVIPMSDFLSMNLNELQQELIDEVQEMLNISKSMEQKVAEKSPKQNILQNEIDRLLEVSLTQEIRDCVLLSVEEQENEMLTNELEKSSSDSKVISKPIYSCESKFLKMILSDHKLKALSLNSNYNIKKRKWIVTSLGSQDCQR
ncbi:hypothetical protein Tco_1297052 [Tanacetum coccineum]